MDYKKESVCVVVLWIGVAQGGRPPFAATKARCAGSAVVCCGGTDPMGRFRGQIAAACRVVRWIGVVPMGSTFSRPLGGRLGSAVVGCCGTGGSLAG